MTTTLVIPLYNGLEFLKDNIVTYLNCDVEEIVFVDDYSADNTLRFVNNYKDKIKILKNYKNKGFPYTANLGIHNSKSELILLLNQDATISNKNLKMAKDILKKENDLFAITFNVENQSWPSISLDNGLLQYKNGVIDGNPHQSLWASGGASIFKKEIYIKAGGFDNALSPGYLEDLDLGWRIRKQGYRITWLPHIKATHASPESSFNKKYKKKNLDLIKERNYLIVHWKNLDFSEIPIHVKSLIKRVSKTKGYIIPIILALKFIPGILYFRLKNKSKIKYSNIEIMNQVK